MVSCNINPILAEERSDDASIYNASESKFYWKKKRNSSSCRGYSMQQRRASSGMQGVPPLQIPSQMQGGMDCPAEMEGTKNSRNEANQQPTNQGPFQTKTMTFAEKENKSAQKELNCSQIYCAEGTVDSNPDGDYPPLMDQMQEFTEHQDSSRQKKSYERVQPAPIQLDPPYFGLTDENFNAYKDYTEELEE